MGWRTVMWPEQTYWSLTCLGMLSWEVSILLGSVGCPSWKLRMLLTSLVHGLPTSGSSGTFVDKVCVCVCVCVCVRTHACMWAHLRMDREAWTFKTVKENKSPSQQKFSSQEIKPPLTVGFKNYPSSCLSYKWNNRYKAATIPGTCNCSVKLVTEASYSTWHGCHPYGLFFSVIYSQTLLYFLLPFRWDLNKTIRYRTVLDGYTL